jgi:hypothetical protein
LFSLVSLGCLEVAGSVDGGLDAVLVGDASETAGAIAGCVHLDTGAGGGRAGAEPADGSFNAEAQKLAADADASVTSGGTSTNPRPDGLNRQEGRWTMRPPRFGWGTGDRDILIVLDAGYEAPRIAWLLRDLPIEISARWAGRIAEEWVEALRGNRDFLTRASSPPRQHLPGFRRTSSALATQAPQSRVAAVYCENRGHGARSSDRTRNTGNRNP